jgi:tetratricopeptide (TPR) repeat protein
MVAKCIGVPLMVGVLAGCAPRHVQPREPLIQAVGFDGTPHYTLALSEESAARLGVQIEEARADLDANPTSEMAVIWYGRRLAYAGLHEQAIVNYTRGLQGHPDSFKLRRHRGHRFISVRLLEPAISDLARAEALSRDVSNEIEPDGMPNPAGVPLSTTRGNILYHLALAHYLAGSYSDAAETWGKALGIARNDDTRVACTYWLVLCQKRLGNDDRVGALLASVTSGMTIVENDQYHHLLLYFKGDFDEARLRGDAAATNAATVLYGIGAWALLNGDDATAGATFREALATPQWAAFGYIAAEAEVARREGKWAAYEAATY